MKMGKIIALCGKICSGKSTYAREIQRKQHAVILSTDEVTKKLFDNNLGDKHNEMVGKIREYLMQKSCEICLAGCNVILDWGLWTKADRKFTKEYFQRQNIKCEIH